MLLSSEGKRMKTWAHGLGAAVISGSASTAGSVLGAMAAGYDVFDIGFWQIIGGGVIGGALVSAFAYLKQSPLPNGLKPQERPWDGE